MSAGFQCKKFYIAHDQCAMKVGTDGLLLGAYAPLPTPGSAMLDIGAGSGLVSLMLAQRSAGLNPIDAVELDSDAARQAATNVESSPWPQAVQLIKGDILTYQPGKRYRLIVSNPPFFQHSLLSTDKKRNQARHTASLPLPLLLAKAAELLDQQGLFVLILPLKEAEHLLQLALTQGWFLAERCEVKTKADKAVQRLLLVLTRHHADTRQQSLVIHDDNGDYSARYRALLKAFYLKF